MAENSTNSAFALEDVDFDAFYQGAPLVEGSEITFDVAPWDIGGPQPAIVELARTGVLASEVLDVGCGLGDNAIFLAERGYRVSAVDGSETALGTARERASNQNVEINFVQSDAASLAALDDERFATVLDSALYHCLGEQQQREYAAAVRRVTRPGAQLHLFCFAEEHSNEGLDLPIRVSQQNLRANLGPHWDITDIQLERYVTAMTPEFLAGPNKEALAGMGLSIDLDKVRVDEQNRITAPVWHLSAVRR